MSQVNFSDYDDIKTLLEKSSHSILKNGFGTSTLLPSSLVLLVRAGFVLIQLASVPSENVFLATPSFGDDFKGIVGYTKWFSFYTPTDIHNAIIGLLASLLGSGIITTILSGRIRTIGYASLIVVLSAFVQPVVIHWIWHSDGWLYHKEFLSCEVSFKDYAGGLIVHVFGGSVSLIGALFFGRRLILLSKISVMSIGVESPGSSFVGYIFIIVGLIGFSLASFSYGKKELPVNPSGILIINNLVAMAGGILTITFVQHVIRKKPLTYWNLLRCIQGGVAGIVTIAPGIDIYTPEIALAAAVFSATIFYCLSLIILNKTSIEDYCNVISIHFVSGIIGLALPPVLGNSKHYTSQTVKYRLVHVLWQLLCTFTVILFLIIVCTNLFWILLLFKILRSDAEEVNHQRGLQAVEKKNPQMTFLDRLFQVSRNSNYLEPGPSHRDPKQFDTKNAQFSEQSSVTKEYAAYSKNEASIQTRYAYTMTNIDNSSGFLENDFKSIVGDRFRKLTQTNCAKDVPSCYDLHRTHKTINIFSEDYALNKNLFNIINLQKV